MSAWFPHPQVPSWKRWCFKKNLKIWHFCIFVSQHSLSSHSFLTLLLPASTPWLQSRVLTMERIEGVPFSDICEDPQCQVRFAPTICGGGWQLLGRWVVSGLFVPMIGSSFVGWLIELFDRSNWYDMCLSNRRQLLLLIQCEDEESRWWFQICLESPLFWDDSHFD